MGFNLVSNKMVHVERNGNFYNGEKFCSAQTPSCRMYKD